MSRATESELQAQAGGAGTQTLSLALGVQEKLFRESGHFTNVLQGSRWQHRTRHILRVRSPEPPDSTAGRHGGAKQLSRWHPRLLPHLPPCSQGEGEGSV